MKDSSLALHQLTTAAAPPGNWIRRENALAIDWIVICIGAFEILSLFVSSYRANSFPILEAILISVLAYFIVRSTVRTPLHAIWLASLLGVVGMYFSVLGVVQLSSEVGRMKEDGFSNLLAFRSRLIHPIPGWLPGECFTALLLALPFACAPVAYMWRREFVHHKKAYVAIAILPGALICGVLCLSLSRAVFWSMVLFFVGCCALMVAYRVVGLIRGTAYLAGVLLGLLLVLTCASTLYPAIFGAYVDTATTQARSTYGRLDIWRRSLKLAKGHAILGLGSSNAALFLLSTADPQDTTGFASRPFSLPIQILIEKGIVGCGLYAAFLLLLGIEFHRSMRSGRCPCAAGRHLSKTKMRKREQLDAKQTAYKAMKCCFAAGLICVLFRELTYSSLFEHTLTLALTFALAAIAIGREAVTA